MTLGDPADGEVSFTYGYVFDEWAVLAVPSPV